MLPRALTCFLLLLIPESFASQKLQPGTFPSRFLQEVLSPKANQKSCRPTGLIEDACCDFETIEDVNADLSKQLNRLVKSRYFRYWKVDLFRECPFWKEDGSCMNRACAVEEVDESTIPERWRMQSLSEVGRLNATDARSLDKADDTCYFRASDFCQVEDLQVSEYTSPFYVDLPTNPERFTGYAGPSANKVWRAIYEENCFGSGTPFQDPARDRQSGGSGFVQLAKGRGLGSKDSKSVSKLFQDIQGPLDRGEAEQCLEKRVYYRLISGLHASISIHICNEYLDQQTGQWSPNLDCFISRIGEHPERLQNVYFDYVVFMRALVKAAPFLENYDMCSGNDAEDAKTKKQLKALISRASSCDGTFDESSMFSGQDSAILKQEFKQHFRNVSRIMDCVGCDKCRLWGGLQVAGLGTAMKLLFEEPNCGKNWQACYSIKIHLTNPSTIDLTRSEVVSFINTLHRLSESLRAIEKFRQLWAQREHTTQQSDLPSVSKKEPTVEPSPSVPKILETALPTSKVSVPAQPEESKRKESTTSQKTSEVEVHSVGAQLPVTKAENKFELPEYHRANQQTLPVRRKAKKAAIAFPAQSLAPNVFINAHTNASGETALGWLSEVIRACSQGLRVCLQRVSEKLGLKNAQSTASRLEL